MAGDELAKADELVNVEGEPDPEGLSASEWRFIRYYQENRNGTESVCKAWGVENRDAAAVKAHSLLRKPKIVHALRMAERELARRTQFDAEVAASNLLEIRDKCMKPVPVIDFEGKFTGEFQFDSIGANKAVEALIKLHGLNKDKLDVNITAVPLDPELRNREIAALIAKREKHDEFDARRGDSSPPALNG